MVMNILVYRYRKLKISTAPTNAKSQEPLIHNRLFKTKSIGRGQDLESQARRQTVRRLRWMELRRGWRYGES